ncbi:MAG: type II toxin-antitoxin system RelE/ParE family toxin [Isosphaeraceae bacterium]
MARYRLSRPAEEDVEGILAWTHERFGEKARRRYEALLIQAMWDVAEDAERPGSLDRPELAAAARTYHPRHSRDRVGKSLGRAQRPRHFPLYRPSADGWIEIGRVLHDGMDLRRHLPEDHQAEGLGEPGQPA